MLLVLPLLLVGACGDDDAGPPLLMLASTAGTAVVDGATGELRLLARGAAATPDGAVLFESIAAPSSTQVEARSLERLLQSWWVTVDGSHEARVASADGSMVALGPVRAGVPVAPGALAPGRTETTLVIAHEEGASDELILPGNVEPEAFSVDGEALFVIDYQPAEAPTFYQVRRLDLATGELGDVYSVDAELQETMRGTARTQVWDPDGDRLYTLYSLDAGTAFVHILDLDEQWAHCVDLPASIGATSAGMALTDDGRTLYVADAAGGAIAEVDTQELAVTDEGELRPSLLGGASSVAIDGRRLFVGQANGIDVVDRASLEPIERFTAPDSILGLQAGHELYVALPASVAVLDQETGDLLRRLPVDLGEGTILSLGTSSIPTYAGVQCAC